MKKTLVRSQDKRRMLQATTHSFPSNAWIHKITKGKESNKCDLCKALWIARQGFLRREALPEQDLGHIQHTCEALSAAHTSALHRCWRVIHGKLARLAFTKWKYMCITGEKSPRTIWDELSLEFERITTSEYHGGLHMKCSERSGNGSPPHARRTETGTGRP